MTKRGASTLKEKLYLIPRGGRWHYRRRVPKHVAHLDERTHVFAKTRQPVTDVHSPPAEAVLIAREINDATERYWSDLLAGAAPSAADTRYAAAVERARSLGFTYRTAADLAGGRLADIAARIAEIEDSGRGRDRATVDALYGVVDVPQMLLSQLPGRYFELATDRQRDQRADTNRNWRNRRRRAVDLAVDTIGDVPVTAITRPDVLRWRAALLDMVDEGQLTGPYANKCLSYLAAMVREVGDLEQIAFPAVFSGLRIAGTEDRQRPPLSRAFVSDVLLGSDALASMGAELRALVAIVASTGVRPIEFVRMPAANIRPFDPIPHIEIAAAGQGARAAAEAGLKTRHTGRRIPLLGSALAAARAYPDGLPTYRNRHNQATSAIGKFFREHGLMPTPEHSLYSLRHTFKDALRAARAPEDLTDYLMGHRSRKPAYGDGYPLDVLAEYVSRAAFDAPAWLVD